MSGTAPAPSAAKGAQVPIPGKPGRWTRGRDWNGVGSWCDDETAEEICRAADARALKNRGLTIAKALEALLPSCGDKRALTYLDGKGNELEVQSFADVFDCARRIGAYLQREMGLRPGDRAVLLYPPGQEFILAFVGCIYAGVVAVPVYPPHPYRMDTDLPRLNLIVNNSGCKVALTDSQYMLVIRGIAVKNMLSRVGLTKGASWPNLRNVQTDKVRKSYAHTTLLEEANPAPDDLAFLQYTSGSTSAPKGVMVTHANLGSQIRPISMRLIEMLGWTNQVNVVSWLPQYHDMGLIGIFLTCLTTGTHLIYMTPISFLQDPTVWLQTMHRYRAQVTCAPNFAFALAQRKTSEELRDSMDLSCILCVICGAEPIRTEVMHSFFDYFRPSGFNPKALMPAYGLAEFTLCATCQPFGRVLNILYVDQQVLGAEGRVVLVSEATPGAACYVGVGGPFKQDGTTVRIVNPDTRECQGQGRVGEIWLDGPSKAGGYFDDEEKTQAAFRGVIKGEEGSGRVYLQTGDQGFLHKDELFITGRIKDLIIVRGRNLYPQDIEYAVEAGLEFILRPGCSGSFSHDLLGEETVAYVAELRTPTTDQAMLADAADQIRRLVAEQFQVAVSVVVLVEPRSIPKTTSGKIQRHKCKIGYKEGTLKAAYIWAAEGKDDARELPKLKGGPPAVSRLRQRRSSSLGSDDGFDDEASYVSAYEFEDDFHNPHAHYTHSPVKAKRATSPLGFTSPRPLSPSKLGLGVQAEMSSPPAATGSPVDNGAGGMADQENWDLPDPVAISADEALDADPEVSARQKEFIEKMVEYVVTHREMAREAVGIDQPMSLLGFDSAGFVALGRAMGEWMGKEISPAIVYKYTTIREVAGFLARGADEAELSNPDADDAIEPDLDAPIAVVGIGLKAPGGPTGNLVGKDAFWQFVLQGGDAIREDMPAERKSESNVTLPGGYIDKPDAFDANFFGMSPAEAAHMDYHQGLVLETAWHALEDAGIEPSTLSGRTVGVYIGAISHEFAVLESLRGESSTFAATGISNSLVSNRLSYLLNVRGPSLTLDTACSSSLVAVNDAVRDLRIGQCGVALAGGVNLILSSSASTALKKAGFLSTACRTFDASGEGYCRGEGCGIVVLKRLSRALADGDRVYSIVRGSAVNHDGRTTSLTAPNPLAQEAVLRAAYRDAKITPNQVRYVEAHGTGTKLGDSIEMASLGAVLTNGRDRPDGSKFRCIIASGKSNIGHLEAAAGVMGLIRASLILYHGKVPKAVHFEMPNPLIPWERLPFIIPRATVDLAEEGQADDPNATIVAGVSSFGFGGTNAHVVLESVPKTFDFDQGFDVDANATSGQMTPLPLLLPLSARSEEALKKLAVAYGELLVGTGKEAKTLSYDRALEVCLEAGTRRTHHHGVRLAATGRSAPELKASIAEALEEGMLKPVTQVAQAPEVVFMFTGQGAGYTGMGRQLYERNAVFRSAVDECDGFIAPLLGASVLKTVILSREDHALALTLHTQPALFAIEYALTRVWAMLGVEPAVVLGHSVGEIVASVVAGVLSLADGCKLIVARAKAMHAVPAGRGGMTVAFVSEAEGRELEAAHGVELAAVNGATCITLAGAFAVLDAMEGALKARNIRYKRLDVARAFHSSLMEPALPAMREVVGELTVKAPKGTPRLISLLNGEQMLEAPGPEHWADHVRKPVLFLQGMQALLADGRPRVFIELGPDAALTAMAKRIVKPGDAHVALIPTMTQARREDENLRLAEAFGRAYVAGVNLKFGALKVGPPMAPSVELPLYPFDKTVFAPLETLMHTALATIGGKPQALPAAAAAPSGGFVKDYGKTNLFEESWLLREERSSAAAARARLLPPAHTVYICSEPTDAAALASVKALLTRSHTIVVPQDSEAAARAALGEHHPNRHNIVGADLLAGGDELKRALGGPNEADFVALVYIAGGEGGGLSPSLEDLGRLTDSAFGESAQLLRLLRTVAEMGMGKRAKMWVITTRAKVVAPGDKMHCMGAPLWSMAKSAMQESYPSLWASVIDLPGPGKDQPPLLPSSMGSAAAEMALAVPAAARLVQLLDGETASYGPKDPPEQLAFRRGRWLVMKLREAELARDIEPAALQKVEEDTRATAFPPAGVDVELKKTLSQDGWYLITGGLGGLGLHAAFALARHGCAKLILTSRGGKPTAQYKPDLDALMAIPGLEVRPYACDTGDRQAVLRMFADFESQGGIRGVVHCAGILFDGNLLLQDVDKLGAVWGGKVDGAVNLHVASMRQARPLDLWITYSSSSALVGSPGQANYSAANAALDCIANFRRQAGLVGTSFQWGVWVGVGFAEPSFLEQLDSVGFPSITKGLGSLILSALLNRPGLAMPRVVCCHPVRWSVFLQHGPDYMISGDLECFEPVKHRLPPKKEPVPLTEDMKSYGALDSGKERLEMVEGVLLASIKKATGKELSRTQNLGECGIASLEAVELIETLTRRFLVQMPLGKLLEYPTVESLSKYLTSMLNRVVDASRPLPLSKGQELVVAQGQGRQYLYQEITFQGALASQALLEAWRQLLGRHPVLRTILDLQPAADTGARQQALPLDDTPHQQMFGAVVKASKAKDTQSLEMVLGAAAANWGNVPGARLLLVKLATAITTNPTDATVVLAVPRLLCDRWSLRLLAGELTALYILQQAASAAGGQAPALAPPHMSYHEAMKLKGSGAAKAAAGQDRPALKANRSSYTSSVGSEKARAIMPMSIVGLTEGGSKAKDDSQSVSLTLHPALAQELSAFAIKARVPPSTVLLAAFVLALWERSDNTEASLRVDLDQRVARGEVVGPVLVPFALTLHRAHAARGPNAFATHVRRAVDEALSGLQLPQNTGFDAPMRSIPQALPGFAFQEAAGAGLAGEGGVVGQEPLQAVQLSVVAGLAADKKATEYALRLESGPGYLMTELNTLMGRVAFNLREVLLPNASRKKSSMAVAARESGASSSVGLPFGAPVPSGAATKLSMDKGAASMVALEMGTAATAAAAAAAAHGPALPWVVVALLQLVGTAVMGSVLMVPVLLVWPLVQAALDRFGQAITLALVPLFYHLMGLIICASILVLRELLTRGRLPAGDYPVNSAAYLRWWFMARLEKLASPVYMDHMKGTALYTWWLRALGADIGHNVRFAAGALVSDPDLLTLGDDVLVGKGARLMGSVVRDGVLRRGRVEVGARAQVQTHAVMLPGASLGADAVLDRLSVAAEGQQLASGGVYEAAPARFRRPRDDVETAAHQADSPATLTLGALGFFLHAFLAPVLATLSAAIAYQPTAALGAALGLFPFFDWVHWPEGPVVFALFATMGVVPMLAFPTLFASMSVLRARAMLLPDAVLLYPAKQAGMAVTAQGIRDLLKTQEGIDTMKGFLPAGTTIEGPPGDAQRLMFVTPGKTAIQEVMLDGFGLPAATLYGVFGVFWVLALGFIIQGFVLTFLTNLAYYLLLAPPVSSNAYRTRGFKAHLRQVKVSVLRWAYDRFMRLFVGTDLLPLWYWTLGATMGTGVVIGNTDVWEDPHLVTLKDGVTITDGAALETATEPGNGYAHCGRVTVGKEGVVAVRAVLAPGTELGDGAVVMPQSAASGIVVPDAVMMGVPARKILDRSSLPRGDAAEEQSCLRSALGGFVHEWAVMKFVQGLITPLLSCGLTLLLVLFCLYPPGLFFLWAMADRAANGLGWPVLLAKVAAPIAFLGFWAGLLVMVVLEKWAIRGRQREGGVVPVRGARYHLRSQQLVFQSYASTAALDTLRGSVLAPLYLNLLGGKVAASAYVDTLNITEPDLVTVGKGAVLDADAILMPNALEGKSLVMGPVTVEEKARMGGAALALRNCSVRAGAELAETALLPPTLSLRVQGVRWGAFVLEEEEEEEV